MKPTLIEMAEMFEKAVRQRVEPGNDEGCVVITISDEMAKRIAEWLREWDADIATL